MNGIIVFSTSSRCQPFRGVEVAPCLSLAAPIFCRTRRAVPGHVFLQRPAGCTESGLSVLPCERKLLWCAGEYAIACAFVASCDSSYAERSTGCACTARARGAALPMEVKEEADPAVEQQDAGGEGAITIKSVPRPCLWSCDASTTRGRCGARVIEGHADIDMVRQHMHDGCQGPTGQRRLWRSWGGSLARLHAS